MIRKRSYNPTSFVACSSHRHCKEKCFASPRLYEHCSNLYIHGCMLDLADTRSDRYVPANGQGLSESCSESGSRLLGSLSRIAMGWHRPEFLACRVLPIRDDSPASNNVLSAWHILHSLGRWFTLVL